MSVEKIKRSDAALKRRAAARDAAAEALKTQSMPETIKKAMQQQPDEPQPAKLTKAERKKQHAEAVARQVEADAMTKPKQYEDDVKPGDKLTLHQLNMRAKAINRATRDIATSIGRQVGKQARDLVLTGDERRRTGQGRRDIDAKIASRQQQE